MDTVTPGPRVKRDSPRSSGLVGSSRVAPQPLPRDDVASRVGTRLCRIRIRTGRGHHGASGIPLSKPGVALGCLVLVPALPAELTAREKAGADLGAAMSAVSAAASIPRLPTTKLIRTVQDGPQMTISAWGEHPVRTPA